MGKVSSKLENQDQNIPVVENTFMKKANSVRSYSRNAQEHYIEFFIIIENPSENPRQINFKLHREDFQTIAWRKEKLHPSRISYIQSSEAGIIPLAPEIIKDEIFPVLNDEKSSLNLFGKTWTILDKVYG